MQGAHPRSGVASFVGLMAVGLLVSATDLQAQGPTDHFKCYVANELTLEQPVLADLEDQFGERLDVMVHNAGWFCNPTFKEVEAGVVPILEPFNHLTLYPLSNKHPEPRRLVTVRNQFGVQEIVVTAPRLLAVPTQKEELPPPDNISHFLCYQGRSRAIHVPATLRDQFQEEDVELLSATFFCNPAAKTIDGVTTPPETNEDHLTCYKFAPSDNPTAPEFADFSNQIDEEDTLRIGPSQYLCVPSEKLDVRMGGRNPGGDEGESGTAHKPRLLDPSRF